MATNNTSGKILIIGAGLGGLVLAQALRQRDVPFEIFERDAAPDARKQGWAIALLEALPAIEELLPGQISKNLRTNSVNHITGDNDEIAFVNALTGERVALVGGVPLGQPGSFLRASREALREFLWKANDLPVSSNKAFTHYETSENGVTAFFKDGSSASGSLLVGADGVHSHVLNQLIGDSAHQPVLSQYVPIFGELSLPPKQYEPLRSLAKSAIIAAAPGLRLQIGMLSMAEDRSSSRFFWALMPRREDPEPLVDWVQGASKQELYEFAMKACQGLDPTVTALIKYGGPEAIIDHQPKFLEFVPPHELPEGRVTVLGDAGHAMIPFRGAGANTAILDACDLAKLLYKSHEEASDPRDVVRPYLAKMIPRGREAVLSSRAAGGADGDDPAVHFKKFQRKEN